MTNTTTTDPRVKILYDALVAAKDALWTYGAENEAKIAVDGLNRAYAIGSIIDNVADLSREDLTRVRAAIDTALDNR